MSDVRAPNAPWVAMRVDASARIGTGHLMRCLTLADALALRGIETVFLCRHVGPLAPRIAEGGHRLERLAAEPDDPAPDGGEYGSWLGTTQARDAERSANALGLLSAEGGTPLFVLVDHYGLDAAWEQRLRAALPDVELGALDDLDRVHDVDFLIDPTFGKTEENYRGRVPPACRLGIGASHALLRPDFAQARPRSLERRDAKADEPPRRLLIAMGGADEGDATGWVLDAMAAHAPHEPPLRVDVLVGAAYRHGDRLAERAAASPFAVELHRDVRDVAGLLVDTDLAIGAAGSSTWERCALGVPTLNVTLADNQRTNARALAAKCAAADGGELLPDGPRPDAETWMRERLSPLVERPDRVAALSRAARDVVDGYGTMRALSVAFGPRVRDGELVLRAATMEDAPLLHEWQSFPETRRYAVNPAVPSWSEHEAWLARRLRDEGSFSAIALADGIACGTVRLDPSSDTPAPPQGAPWREVSILAAPEFTGLGVGRRMLHALQRVAAKNGECIVAHVLDGNSASRALFHRCSYVPYEPEYLVWPAPGVAPNGGRP